MTSTPPPRAVPAFALAADLKKAKHWIARWKVVGGGFQISIGPNGPHVSLARKVAEGETERTSATMRAANALERELNANSRTQLLVFGLARDAWATANQPQEALPAIAPDA